MKNTMTKRELAAAFDCTPRWIDRLVESGMPRAGRAKFEFLKCGAWYARYLHAAVERRNGEREASLSFSRDRLRLARVQADKAELATARLRRELIPLATLVATERNISEVVRRHFGNKFVERVTTLIIGADRAQIVTILRREIRVQLCSLASEPPPPIEKAQ